MLSNKKKALLLAALNTGVAILLLGYSAYGWFNINNEVHLTGMNVNVYAPDNLEISATGRPDDFTGAVTVNLKETVRQMIADRGDAVQYNPARKNFFLIPTSSYNGLTTWFTTRVDGNGSALCGEDEFIAGKSVAYNSENDAFEGNYIDVKLYFRTASQEDVNIGLSREGSYIETSSGSEVGRVVRVAFLNEDASAVSNTANPNYEDALVLADENASLSQVVTLGQNNKSAYSPYKYIDFDKQTNFSKQTICDVAGLDYQGTGVYNQTCITIRIWVEGQDNACSAAIGSSIFNVHLEFVAL